MTVEIARLPMSRPLRAVRVPARAADGAGPSPADRLLELRDAVLEQQATRAAVEACSAAAQRALGELRAVVDDRLEDVASMSTELGLAVAREIVGDVLARGALDPLPIVRRCLQQAVAGSERADLVVRLSAADHARVQPELAATADPRATFVVDRTLTPGHVRVETGVGAVVYDPSEVLRRLCDELRKELAACR